MKPVSKDGSLKPWHIKSNRQSVAQVSEIPTNNLKLNNKSKLQNNTLH